MKILKSFDLNRDEELCKSISNKNLNQCLKICKRRYTKESVINQKVQKVVPVIDGNWKLECEKWSKTFWKIFGTKNMLNQTNTKHFSKPEDNSKLAKNF